MAYIGSKPADKVLTASDITDGVVSNAKLAQDIISADTELAVAPASTDEFLVSDAGTLKRIDYSLIKAANTPAFAAYASGDQTLTDNTWTKLEFDTEIYDTGGGYDNTNDKFVVPSDEAGKYSFSARCNIDTGHNTDGASDAHIGIYVNGALYSNQQQRWLGYPQRNVGVNLTQTLDLSVSDYVEIYVLCDESSGYNNAESSDKHIYFEGFKLIGV